MPRLGSDMVNFISIPFNLLRWHDLASEGCQGTTEFDSNASCERIGSSPGSPARLLHHGRPQTLAVQSDLACSLLTWMASDRWLFSVPGERIVSIHFLLYSSLIEWIKQHTQCGFLFLPQQPCNAGVRLAEGLPPCVLPEGGFKHGSLQPTFNSVVVDTADVFFFLATQVVSHTI